MKYLDSKSLDFGFAMYAIVNKNRLKLDEVDGEPEKQCVVKDALSQMENDINVTRFRELKEMVGKYFLHGLIVGVGCEYPSYDVKQVIHYIRDLDEAAFYKNYVYYVVHENTLEPEKIKEKIDNLNRNNMDKTTASFTSIQYVRRHSSEIQARFVDFCEFLLPIYEHAYEPVRPLAIEALNIFKEKMPDLDAFLGMIPMLDESLIPQDIDMKVYVTAMLSGALFIHNFGDKAEAIIGSSITYLLTDDFKEKQKIQFYKCLSEPTKLKILDLIRDEKLCAADLVERLDMSKSNISHHLSQLATANLIQLAEREGKRTYYMVNTAYMSEMFEKTLKAFKEES